MLLILCFILLKFSIILLYYAPNFMNSSQNYSQDQCQRNPVPVTTLVYCNA